MNTLQWRAPVQLPLYDKFLEDKCIKDENTSCHELGTQHMPSIGPNLDPRNKKKERNENTL